MRLSSEVVRRLDREKGFKVTEILIWCRNVKFLIQLVETLSLGRG